MARKSNVVKLKPRGALTAVQKRTANSAVAEPIKGSDDEHKFLEDLRGDIWSGSSKETWKEMGDKAGLSPATVSNFATGNTKRPSLFTIRRLLAARGFRLTWVK